MIHASTDAWGRPQGVSRRRDYHQELRAARMHQRVRGGFHMCIPGAVGVVVDGECVDALHDCMNGPGNTGGEALRETQKEAGPESGGRCCGQPSTSCSVSGGKNGFQSKWPLWGR